MPTPTAHKDAQAFNDSARNVRQYSDLDLFFSAKGVSKDISKVTDIQAVKRSIRNLVLTNHYEKPFHPEIGSGVRDMLFEPMTPITANILARKIEDVIENFEPRAKLVGIRAFPNLDRNEYEVTIEFYVVNTPTELVDLTVMLGNLKLFLKAQTEFKDYDFEGSGMSALLDVLAYNTHYLGFNANMLANEMFLDSASLRSSIVSHAKTLGYVPTSARASTATVDITLNTLALATSTMSAGTVFNTTVDGTAYQFTTSTAVTASNTGAGITYNDTKIYEGTFISTRYTVDSTDADQRFLLTSNSADTTTLTVKVQTSSSDTTTNTYTEATDITQVGTDSNVYFLQEVERGLFEVYFGDGVVGTALSDDNIVILTYVVSNRDDANGAAVFTNAAAIGGVTDVSVATVATATGGSDPETLKSIKYNAPLDYASQGRCVTAEDYKVYAKKLFPNAQSVSVFGGESGSYDTSLGAVSTAEYGKVFISIKSTTGLNKLN